jgi:hypothetical protein
MRISFLEESTIEKARNGRGYNMELRSFERIPGPWA